MSMFTALITVVVYLLVFGLIWYLIKQVPGIPVPISTVITWVLVVLLILVVLDVFGLVNAGVPRIRLG
jgi:hypothetical protein